MKRSLLLTVALAFLAILLFLTSIGFTHWQRKQIPENIPSTPRETETIRSLSSSPSIDHNSTATWKTYRNENYGIVFKYPDSLKVLESYSIHTGERVILIPTNQQIANDFYVKPKIAITSTCVVPGNIPEEVWESDFREPVFWYAGPLRFQSETLLKAYDLGTRKLFVFNQGCYECYDGWDSETQTPTSHPDKENDGYSAYSCEKGVNENGNMAALCLEIITERKQMGTPALEELRKFFFDDFLPNLELQHGLMIRDCEGLGESVGKIPLPRNKA